MIKDFDKLAEQIINGELRGTIVLKNGVTYSSDCLKRNLGCDTIYPYILVNISYTNDGRSWYGIESRNDIVEFIKDKEMKEERTVNLTIDKACEWYEKGSELREVALQAFTEEEINEHLRKAKIPTTWEEYVTQIHSNGRSVYWIDEDSYIEKSIIADVDAERNKNIIPSKALAEAFLAYMQLMSLRQAWIGDWNPIWERTCIEKFCIVRNGDSLTVEDYRSSTFPRALSFPTEEMAQDFLRNFRTELENAKELF